MHRISQRILFYYHSLLKPNEFAQFNRTLRNYEYDRATVERSIFAKNLNEYTRPYSSTVNVNAVRTLQPIPPAAAPSARPARVSLSQVVELLFVSCQTTDIDWAITVCTSSSFKYSW